MQFPTSFFFGVADADLQVIGEDNTLKEEQSEKTMWYHFAQNSGKCHNNETPGAGIDRYHLWPQDIELMKSLGVKYYRTSISMSRTLKEDGSVNEKAMDWYKQYFEALQKAGISIYATLYHWELPQYLSMNGGWTNRATIDTFTRHTEAVVTYLNEYIEEYFILNEPWCASMLSYHLGIHAPGEKNLSHALAAAHHLLLAQGKAFGIIRSLKPNAKISTVVNTETAYAYTKSEEDELAARKSDGYFNRWFCDPVFNSTYPEDMVTLYGDAMPEIKKGDMKTIKIGNKLHALGVNYYCGRLIKADKNAPLGFSAVIVPEGKTNSLGWPICIPPHYPEGLYDMLQQLWTSYSPNGLKRMYITENGMALHTPWDKKSAIVNDQPRIEYIEAHLSQLHKAVENGIPVEGYFAWTLMDNYEWAEGYRPESCFGMVYVDRKTMKRIPKTSALWYAKVMKNSSIEK